MCGEMGEETRLKLNACFHFVVASGGIKTFGEKKKKKRRALSRGLNTNTFSLKMHLIHTSRSDLPFSAKKVRYFFISPSKICCGYSLKAPHWGHSNEYPQHGEIKKYYLSFRNIIYLSEIYFLLVDSHRGNRICKLLLWFNAKTFVITIYAEIH